MQFWPTRKDKKLPQSFLSGSPQSSAQPSYVSPSTGKDRFENLITMEAQREYLQVTSPKDRQRDNELFF